MLSIGAMSGGQERYYSALARADYYREGGEPEGLWLGSGAKALGLDGTVRPEDLTALFRGFGRDQQPLVRNAGKTGKRGRQPGWDLVLSVPKSVSLMAAISSQRVYREIETAIRAAAEQTLKYLQEEAAFSRIGRGGQGRVPAGLVAAAYLHSTSRALDPQYHVHLLCLNLGVGSDGKVRTILSKPLYEHKMAAGALFRVELAHQLQQRLGLTLARPSNARGEPQPWFEVKGVPENVCRAFSKRRDAIEQELGSQGLESASAAAFATLKTRLAKTPVPPREELLANWQSEAQRHGFTAASVERLLSRAPQRNPEREYQKALQEAVTHITSSESHFSHRDLLRRTLEASQGRGLSAGQVRDWVRRDLATSKQFIELGERKGQVRYTTREVLGVERELLQSVKNLAAAKFTPLPTHTMEKAVAQDRPRTEEVVRTPPTREASASQRPAATIQLNDEQVRAVRYLTQEPARLKVVTGLAGTGKTAMLRAAREALEQEGYRVLGCALSGVAAQRLEEGAGIQSDTLRMRLVQLYPEPSRLAEHHLRQLARAALDLPTAKPQRLAIDRKTVVVLDEAGMVGTRDFALLAKAVEQGGGMLVCVGDPRQLPAIEAGGAFGAIARRYQGVELTDITRQEDLRQREAVQRIAVGEGQDVLREFARQGCLRVEANRQQAAEKLMADWKASGGTVSPEKHVIFVPTNREVDQYNDLAQRERVRAGQLNLAKSLVVGEETFFVGDRIAFLKKSRTLDLENGHVGSVLAVRDAGTVRSLAVQLDGETAVRIIPVRTLGQDRYMEVRRAYAFTTHKLQGTTVEHAYVHLGGERTDREMFYVQASRHRKTLQLYTDEHEAGPALTQLARRQESVFDRQLQIQQDSPLLRQVQQSRVKELAHDISVQQLPRDVARNW